MALSNCPNCSCWSAQGCSKSSRCHGGVTTSCKGKLLGLIAHPHRRISRSLCNPQRHVRRPLVGNGRSRRCHPGTDPAACEMSRRARSAEHKRHQWWSLRRCPRRARGLLSVQRFETPTRAAPVQRVASSRSRRCASSRGGPDRSCPAPFRRMCVPTRLAVEHFDESISVIQVEHRRGELSEHAGRGVDTSHRAGKHADHARHSAEHVFERVDSHLRVLV